MEISEQNKKLRVLAELLEERDRVYLDHTKNILELLAPTLLIAVTSFFNLDQRQIHWHEVKTHDATVSLLATVFLDQDSNPIEVDGETDQFETSKIIRITFPIDVIFQPVENIVDWLTTQEIQHVEQDMMVDRLHEPDQPLHSELNELGAVDRSTNEFDSNGLSRDQIQQMLFFQHQSKGTKQ